MMKSIILYNQYTLISKVLHKRERARGEEERKRGRRKGGNEGGREVKKEEEEEGRSTSRAFQLSLAPRELKDGTRTMLCS